jgi:RHS repeat-associated protein
MIGRVPSGIAQYFLSDRLSTRVVLNTSGNVLGRQAHLSFGSDFAESGTQEKHHLTSYERDGESGLDYAVNRYDSASLGRFLSADPLTSAKIEWPQSHNKYSYTQNEAINAKDPLGLILCFGPGCTWPENEESNPCDATFVWGGTEASFDPFCIEEAVTSETPEAVESALIPGSLKIQSSCQNVVYLPEEPDATSPNDWGPPGDNVWQDCDAVATPRGIVKIPDGCGCTVSCDGGLDYQIDCHCIIPFGINPPRLLGPGEEFPNPRLAGYTWVYTRDPYVRRGAYIFD